MPIKATHPFHFVFGLRDLLGSNATLHFSRYIYTPKSLQDDRTVFSVRMEDFTEDAAVEWLRNLREGEELALQSNVEFSNRKVRHLMLVDFSRKDIVGKYGQVLSSKYSEIFERFVFFDSGRSVHGYGADLLSEDEWYKFMGTLLLLNDIGTPQFVDSRWIGHRLRAGYGALRWSANTSQYLKIPARISSKKEEEPSVAF